MVLRASRCDASRLRLLLEDRLPDGEQAEISGHLERCESCRLELERMAAEGRWWEAARRLAIDAAATDGREPAGAGEEPLAFLEPPDGPGQLGRLGRYEVTEVIGRGGMGVVLKAFDRPLGRFVAIKVLAPELATSATARRRFAREAQAVAAIAHEHIVAIHAVDATAAGLPYIVMHHVSGRSLQDRLDHDGALEVREVLRIGMQAASGLAAAHAVGLVHRDIKPANILLEDGVGRVKLTDFGLARAADDASLTQSGVVAGTPQYMAPEQARGEPIDARADLFSLGSVLYALCTGRPPFRGETTMGVLRRVCEDTPRPIRETAPEVPDWLQAIVEKLQAKDPAGRFGSAAEVAALFGRCLAHLERPGDRPPFLGDRPGPPRTARPRLVAVAALLLASALGLGAAEAAGITGLSGLVATVLRIKTPHGTLVLLVDDPEVKVRIDGEDVVLTEPGPQEVRLSLRAGEHRVEKAKAGVRREELITITRGGKQTLKVTFEPDPAPAPGAALAGPGLLEPSVDRLQERIKDLEAENRRIEHDRHRLMTEGLRIARGDLGVPRPGAVTVIPPLGDLAFPITTVRVNPVTKRLAALPSPGGVPVAVYSVAVSPDGKALAAGCSDGAIRLYDRASGETKGVLAGHRASVRAVAYAPDGRTLASAGGDYRNHEEAGELKLWDLAEGRVRRELAGHTALVWSVAFSPDGRTLASGAWDNTARLWDAASGKLRAVLNGHRDAVRFVAFSRGAAGDAPREGSPLPGAMLATAGFDGEVRFWHHDPDGEEDGKLWKVRAIAGVSGLSCLAFSPDNRTLAVSPRPSAEDRSKEIVLLDLATWTERGRLRGDHQGVISVVFSPDGRRLASGGGIYDPAGGPGEVVLWDVAGLRALARSDMLRHRVESIAFTPDGSTVVAGGGLEPFGGEVRSWSAEPAPAASTPAQPRARTDLLKGQRIWSLAYSPDGRTLAIGSGIASNGSDMFSADAGALTLWTEGQEPPGPSAIAPRYLRSVVFSPGGGRIASAEIDGTTKLRDATTGEILQTLEGHREGVNGAAFSPDGRTLVTAGLDATVRTWDIETGGQIRELEGHLGPVYSVAVRPDGRSIASAGSDRTIRLWDFNSSTARAVLQGHHGAVESVAFSPDGKTLASASWDRTAKLWDAESGRELATLSGHSEAVLGAAFSPDGKTLATCGGTWDLASSGAVVGEVKLWDVATRSLARSLGPFPGRIFAVAFSPDGRSLAAGSWDGTLIRWDMTVAAHPGRRETQ